MISDVGLLYIEPRRSASAVPSIDRVTRRMCAAFRQGRPGEAYRGVHECICGAISECCDYQLPNGEMTNSLCMHYLAHHRSEVPPEQIARISEFAFGETKPSEQELQGPALVLARIRKSVESNLGPDRRGTWVAWGLDTAALYDCLRGEGPSHLSGWEARGDAEILCRILYSIDAKALPLLLESIHRTHRDVRSWGAEALRMPGWKRDAWPIHLAAIMTFAVPSTVGPARPPKKISAPIRREALALT